MSWINTDGKMSENILFSKVTYTRNISGLPFPHTSCEAVGDIIAQVEAILKKNGFHNGELSLKDKTSCLTYHEKQYVDMDFCNYPHQKAVLFNEPCSLCVSVGGTSLISIYAILPGLSVRDAYNISSSAEELLDSGLSFAYSEEHGYLCPVPNDCGTGMRISCALYLPCLSESGKIFEVTRQLGEAGISIYPLFSCKPGGDVYIMTCSPHKDIDESISVEKFERAVLDVIGLERGECCFLGSDMILKIVQGASAALGALTYSYAVSEEELISLTSSLRRYITLPEDKLKYNVSASAINTLLFENLSSSVIQSTRAHISSADELDIQRAQEIKKYMSAFTEKSEVAHT